MERLGEAVTGNSEAGWEANPHKEELETDLLEHFREAASEAELLKRRWQVEELYGAALSNHMPMEVINGIYSTARTSLDSPELLDDFEYGTVGGETRQVWPIPHHGETTQNVWFPVAKEE